MASRSGDALARLFDVLHFSVWVDKTTFHSDCPICKKQQHPVTINKGEDGQLRVFPSCECEKESVQAKLLEILKNGSGANGSVPANASKTGNPKKTDRRNQSTKISDDVLSIQWAEANRNKFLFAEGDEWWEYDGQSWAPVSHSTIYSRIISWLKDRFDGKPGEISQHRVKGIAFLAASLMGDGKGPIGRGKFNADRNLIPLENGMLDLEARELLGHSPSYRNTYCLPYAYDPEADCPRFRRFLGEVMLSEDQTPCQEWKDLLVEWMGYCLIPDSRAETVLVNVGEGGNGKSLWAKVVEALVGDVNCASIDPRQLEMQPGYTLASLYGKLVGFLNEPTRNQIQGCSGSLKAIVSGDLVQARHPAGRPFTYRPHVRIVVSANDMPDTKDLSLGFFRRLLVVEWRFRPPNPDPHLDRKLLQEMAGILNLALEGLDRLRARGGDFPEPDESKALKQEYRLDQDSAAQMLLTALVEADPSRSDIWCLPTALYELYTGFCKRSGYQPMTLCAFGRHLTKRLGYPPKRSRRDDITGEVTSVRFGIRIKEDQSHW